MKPPVLCDKCGRRVYGHERKRKWCSTCEVASWSPEKRAAIKKCIGLAFRKPPATEAEKDVAFTEAFKHVGETTDEPEVTPE